MAARRRYSRMLYPANHRSSLPLGWLGVAQEITTRLFGGAAARELPHLPVRFKSDRPPGTSRIQLCKDSYPFAEISDAEDFEARIIIAVAHAGAWYLERELSEEEQRRIFAEANRAVNVDKRERRRR